MNYTSEVYIQEETFKRLQKECKNDSKEMSKFVDKTLQKRFFRIDDAKKKKKVIL
jgi:hypothetical protein